MELRREVYLTIGVLVVLNLVLAFGAIGLFVRMGPAIEKILQENVYSIIAAEEVLEVLANAGDTALSVKDQKSVWQSLEKAKKNITEVEEVLVLKIIENQLREVVKGKYQERASLIDNIKKLIAINRDAMKKVGQAAQRLEIAGAWASVFIGFFSFTLSLIVFNRLRQRFLAPMIELHEVLEAHQRGEQLRRCKPGESPREVRQVIDAINKLLDERLRSSSHDTHDHSERIEHLALLALVEKEKKAAVILDRESHIVCANNRALDLLSSSEGEKYKQIFSDLANDNKKLIPQVDAQPLRGNSGWLCYLDEADSVQRDNRDCL